MPDGEYEVFVLMFELFISFNKFNKVPKFFSFIEALTFADDHWPNTNRTWLLLTLLIAVETVRMYLVLHMTAHSNSFSHDFILVQWWMPFNHGQDFQIKGSNYAQVRPVSQKLGLKNQ